MAKINFKTLKIEVEKEIKKSQNLKDLDEIFRKYLGKRGQITQILHSLEKSSDVLYCKKENEVSGKFLIRF